MYRAHFGLTDRPFAETLDPSWLVPLPGHASALHRLRYGLEDGACVAATGPSGTGKSLLARALIRDLGGPSVVLAYPALPAPELMAALADGLLAPEGSGERRDLLRAMRLGRPEPIAMGDSLRRIGDLLAGSSARGERPVVVVEDAHLIASSEGFEALRSLLNFARGGRPDLALVLLGDEELMLRMPASLADRLAARVGLLPLTASESAAYVMGRLARAGARAPLFDERALRVLHRESDGLPRRLNRLADLALLIAFARGRDAADAECVEAAASEAGFERAA